ncbi:MAG TPA: hypothetical protein VGN24_03460 [Rhodanobacter sp.]|nr:hypothetical protein [Rhodanobacter sp.]
MHVVFADWCISRFLFSVATMSDPVFMMCDSANVDASTGQCSSPVWVPQPQFIPSLTMGDGALIGFAIMAIWAGAYMARALKVHD